MPSKLLPRAVLTGLTALTLLGLQPCLADTGPVMFSGFGTMAVSATSLDDADYRSRLEQGSGVGATQNPDYGVDSIFALQARTDTWKGLSALAQVQMRRFGDDDSEPSFEWANLKYQLTPNLDLRVGRIVAPEFLVSDSRAVGYSQIPLRLSPEIYQLAPVTYLDGAALAWRVEAGDTLLKFSVNTGSYENSLVVQGDPRDYHFDARIHGIEAERGNSRVRLTYSRVYATAESPAISQLESGLVLFQNLGITNADVVADHLDFDDNRVDFWNLGYVWDDGTHYLQTEYVLRDTESPSVQSHDGFYVLYGQHIDTWTPFAMISRVRSLLDPSVIPLLSSSNPAQAGLVALGNDKLATIRRQQERDALSVGTRWDFQENYCLKLQIDHLRKKPDDQGFFVNASPEFIAERRKVTVYNLSLDFVF